MASHNGRCDSCPAGHYVVKYCNDTTSRECAKCKEGHFTATANRLNSCQICTDCSSDNNLMTVKPCTTKEDAVCECSSGFYCINVKCDHCVRVTDCPVGEGVRVKANRTSNTVCETCQDGTYSNVTDSFSPCRPHTRCMDLGREQKTAGTSEIDAVCGDLHNIDPCQWKLPAALWAGLVVTALILFAVVIYRKAKRRSYRAGSTSRPVTLVKSLDRSLPIASLDLSLPITSLDPSLDPTLLDPKGTGYCQESCVQDEFKIPLFSQDENLVNCSMDSSLPITPLKVSVSFAEGNYNSKGTGYCPGNFLRTPSEPQEDEWCGT